MIAPSDHFELFPAEVVKQEVPGTDLLRLSVHTWLRALED